MDYSLPGTSVHGILQARLLEWVAISDLGGSSRPRHRTHVSSVSCIGKWILYHWATWEALRAEGSRVNEEDLGNSEGVGAGSQGSLGWTLALVAEVPQGHRDQSVWSLCWNVSLCPGNGSSSDRDLLTEIACRVLRHLLDRKGQLTFYSLFSDKGLLTRRLICVDLPKVWCHSQKALIKVTFLHSKDTTIYNKERGVQ